MQKHEIIKKYQDSEDKIFVSRLLDKINERDNKNRISTTDFLNIHERAIAEDILKKEKIQNYLFSGGFEEAERTILIFYPEKLEKEYIEKQLKNWISVIRIILPKYNEKYSHREYLGGIMKLGVKREKIGDIIVYENGADIIVCQDIADYLKQELSNLTRFSKANIDLKEINEIKTTDIKTKEVIIIVPSYRIDAIVAEVIHTSRSKAIDVINEERVFVNGHVYKDGAKSAKIGDKITIRGKGRFEILEELGNTKKENIKLKIMTYL